MDFLSMLMNSAPKRVRSEEDKLNWPQTHIKTDLELAWVLDINQLSTVDRILEPQTPPRFIEFCLTGNLPDGTKTSLPLLHPEEILFVSTPYASWAPAPHSKKPHADAFADRLMIRVGSNEDADRLCLVEKHLHALKTRLWEGLPPMSDARWRERKLEEAKNHALACQHMSAVVDVFSYLNKPSVKARLRTTYDLIYDEARDFERAINAVRAGKGGGREQLNVTGLWKEFMQALYRVMTSRAHSWVTRNVDQLQQSRMRDLFDEIAATGDSPFNPPCLLIMDQLHDLLEISATADYTILMPMAGYKGFEISRSGAGPMVGNLQQRREKFVTRMKEVSRQYVRQASTEAAMNRRRGREVLPDSIVIYSGQIAALAEVRIEFRGEEVEVGELPWVTNLKERLKVVEDEEGEKKLEEAKKQLEEVRGQILEREKEDGKEEQSSEKETGPKLGRAVKLERWGFVAYRLNYEQSEKEWESFLRVLNIDMAQWSEGVQGVEDLENLASLQWVDGRDVGIPEGDVAAAKTHFLTFRESDSLLHGMREEVFFVADKKSTTSYLPPPSPSPPQTQQAGLSGGSLLLVDANFDPNEPDDHAEEYPGWIGEMRVLGSLVFGEIFPCLATQSLWPELLWPLAGGQPERVYVGVTVKGERAKWTSVAGVPIEVQDVLRGAASMWGAMVLARRQRVNADDPTRG